MNLSSVKKIHFIGIGGIGMSALARHFCAEGVLVSGSDRSPSLITDALQAEGVTFYSPQVKENIAPDLDMVVYTEAMEHNHEEMVAARSLGITTVNYFEALGLVANDYYVVAVAGSHGKTTTTAMLIDIFEDADLDPSAVVGSLRSKTGKNYRQGKSKYFIVEACEYKRDFLHLKPDILVITNVEAEHLDYYKDLDDVVSAFNEFARSVPEEGFVVCAPKDTVIKRVLEEVVARVVDYTEHVDLMTPLKQPGLHTRLNAAAATAAALSVGIEKESIRSSLQNFGGTWRRFEFKGVMPKGAILYDDYGHHPTEVGVTLKGARELFPDKRIIVAFHPHLYSRTKLLFNDFIHAFSDADEVVLAPIFAAREVDDGTISHYILKEALIAQGGRAEAFDGFEEITEYLKTKDDENTVIITMGAGDIYKIGVDLLMN